MYRNVAIIDKLNPDLKDLSVPLRINNCGFYRIHDGQEVRTTYPKGRNDYQLIYIAAGKGNFKFQDKNIVVDKGNMVLYRPGEQQIYKYSPTDKVEVYWVHFTGSQVEDFLLNCNLPKGKNVFYTGTSSDFQWLYNQMIRELQLRRNNYDELLQILLRHLLLITNRSIQEQEKGIQNLFNEIESAIHFFNKNYNKPITIEQYAKEHFISTNRFIQNFKNVAGVTPQQYIIQLRISVAKELLVSSDKNIKEIAFEIGYNNALYFSRLFRKTVGLSPSDYRANTRFKNKFF